MAHYGDDATDDSVAIDAAHLALLAGLVRAQKPRAVLEIGIGTARATEALLAALRLNTGRVKYVAVDNWFDFGGTAPAGLKQRLGGAITWVEKDEAAFVADCTDTFDFILSDGDHRHTNEWFGVTYGKLLKRGGILCYHDVTNVGGFPNLLEIYAEVLRQGIPHILCNRNSSEGERCDRGLLVIFKP